MTLMRGVTGVRQAIASFLSTEMPALITVARAQWGLEDHLLPVPKKYDAYDPMTLDMYPIVGMYVTRTSNWSRVDVSPAAEQEYNARYNATIFVYAQTPIDKNEEWVTPIYDEALRTRDDLMAVMRSSILRTPSLRSNGYCRVEEGTLTEDYMDAMKGSSGATWLAGGTISIDLNVSESNYLAPIGTVEQTDADITLLRRESSGVI